MYPQIYEPERCCCPIFGTPRKRPTASDFLKDKFQGSMVYLAETVKTLNTMNPELQEEQHHLYYIVLQEVRAKIQLRVK